MKQIKERSHVPILAGLSAEVCFAFLPLVVLVVVKTSHSGAFLSSPEWAFGASILFGQALVKFVSGVVRRGRAAKGTVALAVSLLLVIGLAPSLIVLTLNLMSDAHEEPSALLIAAQLTLFAVSTLSYLVFGTLGEMWDAA